MKKLTSMLLASCVLSFSAQAQERDFSSVEITPTDMGGGVYMMTGSGGNLGLLTGEDGAILIDSQFAPLAAKISAQIDELSPEPLRFIINTHLHGDHVGANENLSTNGAVIVAHENVRERMSVEQFSERFQRSTPAYPKGALPVVTFADNITLHLNGETVRVIHLSPAHTDGDSMVYFENANVAHTGDAYITIGYPFIDTSSGGSIEGFIAATATMISVVNDETTIIPGHGTPSTRTKIQAFHDMLVEVKTRIQALIDEDKTEEEILAADPLADLNAIWAANENAFIDGESMLKQVYASLSGTGGPSLEAMPHGHEHQH